VRKLVLSQGILPKANSQQNTADTTITSGVGGAFEPECKLRSDLKLNTMVSGRDSHKPAGQSEWRIQWPSTHLELYGGSVTELLMGTWCGNHCCASLMAIQI
jgi:hypothetical protein